MRLQGPEGHHPWRPRDRHDAGVRRAARSLVFDAHTKPELLKRWLGVFGGWTLADCEIDLRVGGAYRYVWRGPNGERDGDGTACFARSSADAHRRTEKFDDPWYDGEAVDDDRVRRAAAARPRSTITMRYASKASATAC